MPNTPDSTYLDLDEQDNLLLNDSLQKILFDNNEFDEAFLGKRAFESEIENWPAAKHRRLAETPGDLSQPTDILEKAFESPIQNLTVIFEAKTKVLCEKGRALIHYVIANKATDPNEKACAMALNYQNSQVNAGLVKAFRINGQAFPNFKALKTCLVRLTDTQLEALKESINDPSPKLRQPRKKRSRVNVGLDSRLKKINMKLDKYQEFLSPMLLLGYNEQQANRIIIRKYSSKTCKFLIAHHNILYALFKHDVLDDEACHEALSKIASHDGGIRNLLAFKNNYETIKALGFTIEQVIRIISKNGGSHNLVAIIDNYQELNDLGFSLEQITRIVNHSGGSHNLLAVKENYQELNDLGFTAKDIIRMVSQIGGSRNLTAVKENYQELKSLGFTAEQIISIVSHACGYHNLAAVKENYEELKDLGFIAQQIIRMVSQIGGSYNLAAVKENYQELKDLGFTAQQIIRMVSKTGGSHNLAAVKENNQELKGLGFTAPQIIRMVSHSGGSQNLAAVRENYQALNDLGFTADQIIRMVSHCGGSHNLTVVKENYRELINFGFTAQQIIRMVSHDSGSHNIKCIMSYLVEIGKNEFQCADIEIVTFNDRQKLINRLKAENELQRIGHENNVFDGFDFDEFINTLLMVDEDAPELALSMAKNRNAFFPADPISQALPNNPSEVKMSF